MTTPALAAHESVPASEVLVRAYRPGDERGILELFADTFGRRPPAAWRWAYRDAPGGSRILLAVDRTGRVVAHYASIAFPARLDGRNVTVSQGIDSVVHPAWRRGLRAGSVFLATARAYFAGAPGPRRGVCTYGFPCRAAMRLGRARLGYEVVHAPLVTLFLNRFASPRRRIGRLRKGDEVVEVARFGASADALWDQVAPAFGFAVRRDRRYLNWRYADAPVEFRTFEIRRRGTLVGLFVVRPGWTGQPILALMDYLADPHDRDALAAALETCGRIAAASEQARIECWLPASTPLYEHARALGLDAEPSLVSLCVRRHERTRDVEWFRRHWHYTIGDSDIH